MKKKEINVKFDILDVVWFLFENKVRRGVIYSIGYGVADYKPYQVWRFGMTEEMFYRKVRQVYWKLNRESYRRNYKR